MQENNYSLKLVSAVDAIIDAIQKEILNCAWEPGEKIREIELC